MNKATAQGARAPAPASETPQQRFERELQERHPGRSIVRFDFPARIREARAVYIKEISSRDEMEASTLADSTMTELEKASMRLSAEAQRKETLRISIVGLVTRTEPLQYRHIGGSVPFLELDDWSAKAMTCLKIYYGQINGLTDEEIVEGLKGQRTIGGTVAPTSATPPAPSTES